jgi:hypothetical protein
MKIKELKSRLKELAVFNRQYKHAYKEWQRGNITFADLNKMSQSGPCGNYRYMHIAYCLLRGRKYEQIENKVKPGNEPSWNAIEHIMAAYREVEQLSDGDMVS